MNLQIVIMVGNDVEEDMEAGKVAGMNVFLLTNCLINRERRNINQYPRDSFEQLMAYITGSFPYYISGK